MARKIRTTISRYVLIDDKLYRTMDNWPLLKCVNKEDGKCVLREYMKVFAVLILVPWH